MTEVATGSEPPWNPANASVAALREGEEGRGRPGCGVMVTAAVVATGEISSKV